MVIFIRLLISLLNKIMNQCFSFLKAEIHFLRGDYYKVEKISLNLIDICPNLSKSYYFLGYLSFQYKDYEKAFNYLEMSLNLGIQKNIKSHLMIFWKNLEYY